MNPKQQEIARLLRAGLDAYGDGDAESAVRAWNAVLALDPHNADARDYIDSVDAEPELGAPMDEAPLGACEPTLLDEVVALLDSGREIDAHARLEAARGAPGARPDLETLALGELVRARLLPIYRAGFGAEAAPRATGDPRQLDALGLSDAAQALHEACDGRTGVDALPAACGLDAFDTYHQLSILVDAGFVSVYA